MHQRFLAQFIDKSVHEKNVPEPDNRKIPACKRLYLQEEIHKKSRIPVEKLAHSIGMKESSLIDRFKRLFGEEYRKIAYSRRDERKVSKKEYDMAFERYKNTNVSLIQLSEELGIKISSLASRFIRVYGDTYRKIAVQKQDL